jgi:hypothetical protein
MLKTSGLSPKAYVPFIGLVVAAVALLATGHTEEGQALLAAAIGQLGLAYAAKPGDVVIEPTPES